MCFLPSFHLSIHPSIHNQKITNPHQYLQFQSSITGLILSFPLSIFAPRFSHSGNPAPPRPAWARTLSGSCLPAQGEPCHSSQALTPHSGPPLSTDTLLIPPGLQHAMPGHPLLWTPSSCCLISSTCTGWTPPHLTQALTQYTEQPSYWMLFLCSPCTEQPPSGMPSSPPLGPTPCSVPPRLSTPAPSRLLACSAPLNGF